jgi:hypothetical protein
MNIYEHAKQVAEAANRLSLRLSAIALVGAGVTTVVAEAVNLGNYLINGEFLTQGLNHGQGLSSALEVVLPGQRDISEGATNAVVSGSAASVISVGMHSLNSPVRSLFQSR